MIPARPLASVVAYLDFTRFGALPLPLWELPLELADELRLLADRLSLPGPWLDAVRNR